MSADSEWLPPPNEPAAFESLCLDLSKEIWGAAGAQKNGRSGQPQAGVDICCQKDGKWIGVQCKQKNGLLRKKLLSKEMEAEVEAAKHFTPALSSFILATSGPADSQIQARARKLTENHRATGLFTVEVWLWEKIWQELHGRQDLLRRVQPVYWPTVGLKRELAAISYDKRFVQTAVLILAAYALIVAVCIVMFGKEIAAIMGGGLTAICVGFHKNFPRLKFERIADSQKKIVTIQKFSWYSMITSMFIFFGCQIACSVIYGVVGFMWLLITVPHFLSTEQSLSGIYKISFTSSFFVALGYGTTFLSYLVGGFFIGKTARTNPHTYAMLGAFLFALLTAGIGVLFADDLKTFAGLGHWPIWPMLRQTVAKIGVCWFLFVWLAWVGAWLAVKQPLQIPRKK